MTANEELISNFYTAFQQKDYKTMQESYADNQNNYQPQVIQETPAVSSNADSSVTSGGSYGVIYPRHK